MDEKKDELKLFLNPLLDKSIKNEDLGDPYFQPMVSLAANSLDRQKIEPVVEGIGNFMEKQCHSEDESMFSGQMADHSAATRTFFLKPICLGRTPFYIDPLFKNKFFLTQKYVVEGLSARQIAKQIFSSKTAVLEALARFEIPIREVHQHHGHPSQPRYGKWYRRNRLVDSKVEKRVIWIIKDLRMKGFSLRKIAQILNEMSVATKCQGKAWHPEMVRRVLGAM